MGKIVLMWRQCYHSNVTQWLVTRWILQQTDVRGFNAFISMWEWPTFYSFIICFDDRNVPFYSSPTTTWHIHPLCIDGKSYLPNIEHSNIFLIQPKFASWSQSHWTLEHSNRETNTTAMIEPMSICVIVSVTFSLWQWHIRAQNMDRCRHRRSTSNKIVFGTDLFWTGHVHAHRPNRTNAHMLVSYVRAFVRCAFPFNLDGPIRNSKWK